jgi:hypothetical protein
MVGPALGAAAAGTMLLLSGARYRRARVQAQEQPWTPERIEEFRNSLSSERWARGRAQRHELLRIQEDWRYAARRERFFVIAAGALLALAACLFFL